MVLGWQFHYFLHESEEQKDDEYMTYISEIRAEKKPTVFYQE